MPRMFCPNCGKGEQTPDSYCRNCGNFLADATNNASLMNRLLGISSPDKQIKFALTINLVTAIVSGLLIFFLMGYFDATYKVTGIPTPRIVYLVYIFLGLVSMWQLFSFTVGTAYRKKLSDRKKSALSGAPEARSSLPPADETNIVKTSITEQTTRNLENVPRR